MIDVTQPPYNADGSGLTDTTAAIQSAIDAAAATGDRVFIPPGEYRVGDLVIEMGILLEGVALPNRDTKASTLRVVGGKNGIIVRRRKQLVPQNPDGTCPPGAIADLANPGQCYIDHNGTGTTIRHLMILDAGEAPPSLDGILIDGAHGVKLEHVDVEEVGGNGFHIRGIRDSYSNANNWQMESCLAYNCGKNGLLVEGGEAQAGLCVALDASANQGWGIVDNSGLGSTYVACHTSANAAGSYTVNKPSAGELEPAAANYSSFLACYAEGGSDPDFSQAPYILVVGGNLAGYNVIGTQQTGDLAIVGADQRIGYTWSRLTFQQQIPISADGTDTREVVLTLPDFPPNTGHHGTIMTFRYKPMASGRQVIENGQWQPDAYAGAVWNIERFVYYSDQEDQYIENSPDRTWVVRTDARTADQTTYGYIIPFGWTDRQHPIGPGHFFFGLPIANQPSHWTWRQSIDQPLAPGNNPAIVAAAGFPADWLTNLGSDAVLALFSIEATGAADFEAVNVSVGAHQILADGTFRVKLFNHGAAVPAGWLTLVAHFELYTRWTSGGY